MSMSSNLLTRAIELFRAGNKVEANRLLKAVVRLEPNNQVAWNWYIETLSDPKERIAALEEYLIIKPDSSQALKALATLKQQISPAVEPPGPQPTRQTAAPQPARTPAASRQAAAAPAGTGRRPPSTAASTAGGSSYFAALIAVFSIVFLVVLAVYAFKVRGERDTLQGHYETLQANHTSLQVAHEVTVQEKAQLKTQLDELWIDYDYLNTVYKDLSKAYLDLEARFNGLALDYINLDSQYNTLLQDYGILQGKYSDLRSDYSALSTEYDDLVAKYSSLYGWYEWLQANAVKPPYIAIHNRQVTLGFYGPLGTVETWTKDISELEQAIITGKNLRDNPSYISLELNGETVKGYDLRPFIDPDAFDDYVPNMYRRAVTDDQFIQDVWRIVSQLTDYSSEFFETPRHPLETFLMGGGDCEDTAILLASMILAAPVDWDVELVLMDANNPYDAQEINHVIVYVDTGWREYLIESTGSSDMLWPEDIEGWYLDVRR